MRHRRFTLAAPPSVEESDHVGYRGVMMLAKSALFTCTAMLALGLMAPTVAHGGSPERGDSFALRAGRIVPVSLDQPWEIENGVMIVRDGRIVALGKDLHIPVDLPLIELPHATVVPGFVAAASDLGGAHRGDESVAAGYRAVDAFDRYGDFTATLAKGVTTVHVGPGSHRLVTGQGAVVKLGGQAAQRILRSAADLAVNLGTAKPPLDVTYSFPASADVAIPMPVRQGPTSRIGQFLVLEAAVREALAPSSSDETDIHRAALARVWKQNATLRISAQRAADVLASIAYLKKVQHVGYLVGAAEADRVADVVRQSGLPLVIRPGHRFAAAGGDVGVDPAAVPTRACDYRALQGVDLALAPAPGVDLGNLRTIAVLASRHGLGERRAFEAITRVPAEVLGVGDRVGSLDPGKDADFLVLTGRPLDVETRVRRVFVQGNCVYETPPSSALVIQAGTVWATPDRQIANGEILIEQGKIVAVGRSVPHPPLAQVIDVRPDGFVTPGLIDGFSHLGLEGDKTSVDNSIRLSKLVGAADITDMRVCRAGVTTVLVAPYAVASAGAPVAAIKTAGKDRMQRVINDPAAVLFDVSRVDPLAIPETLGKSLAAGKKYMDAWAKYDKALKEFLDKKKKGAQSGGEQKKKEEETKESKEPDPVTGTWAVVVRGTPLGDAVTMTLELQLLNTVLHGRILESSVGATGTLTGTVIGTHLSAEATIVGADVPGPIRMEADLTGEDRFRGTVGVQGAWFPLEGKRTDKNPVEITVTRRRLRGKDGRPLPPKRDLAQEPIKALLEKKIPAVVKVTSAAQIREVLDLLVEKHKLAVTLLGAEGASVHVQRLADKKIAVIVPPAMVRKRKHVDYVEADELARGGVPVVFQSNMEDGARHLPTVVLHAVLNGLDAEKALAAMTIDAARAYKIDDRVGSIEPGKDADIVIFNGHPFRDAGQVLRVVVSGQEVRQ